jgi:hypothetical protein
MFIKSICLSLKVKAYFPQSSKLIDLEGIVVIPDNEV